LAGPGSGWEGRVSHSHWLCYVKRFIAQQSTLDRKAEVPTVQLGNSNGKAPPRNISCSA
jgi:hypothetical protein